MIDYLLKKYFEEPIRDQNARKIRVWQRVLSEIHQVEAPVFEISESQSYRYFGWMPLVASFVLVLFSAGFVAAYQDSLPGSRLHTFKLAVEDAKLKLAADDSKQEKQIQIIEKRAEEVVKLEERAASDGHVSEAESAYIEEAKIVVGKKVLALVKEPAKETDTETELEITLVAAADAKVVGQAITNLLKSTVKIEKLEDLEAVVKQVQEEGEAAATGSIGSDNGNSSGSTGKNTSDVRPSSGKNEPSGSGSVIRGEVESEDVEIK